MTVVIDRRGATAIPPGAEATRTLPECATCPGFCCRNDTIRLYPSRGDDVALYEVEPIFDPILGEAALMVAHKPNGDCVYLAEVDGAGRCSVYDHRPAICRAFDCGDAFAKLSRVDRRAMLKHDLANRDTFDQGRRVQEARARRKAQEAREGVGRPSLAGGSPETAPGPSWRPGSGAIRL
jgi:Fe-S-cluster containining protein